MKKTRFLLIFLLFILRGPFLFAQSLELTTTYVKTDSNVCNSLYRITATTTGGVPPYTFRLNTGLTNSLGIFNNLPSSNYTVEVTDSSGQKKLSYIYLPSNPYISASFFAIATLCDSSGLGLYRLIGSGGQSPYSFKVDSVPSSTNAFRLLPSKYYKVTVTDAAGCTANRNLYTPYANTSYSLYANSNFTANQCGDSLGSVKVRLVTNMALTNPLSISFDGRPFSSDSVFTNVKARKSYPVTVKTQACGDKSTIVSTFSLPSVSIVESYFTLNKCGDSTGVVKITVNNGAPPYRFTINGVLSHLTNSLSDTFQNIKANTNYTISVQTADGCAATKTLFALDSLPYYMSFSGDCERPSTLYLYRSTPTNSLRFQVDNLTVLLDVTSYLRWEDMTQGRHVLRVIDSTGCARTDTFTVFAKGLRVGTATLNGACSDSTYRLTVSNGVPPYTLTVNNNLPTTINDFRMKVNEAYYVKVVDANFCSYEGNIIPQFYEYGNVYVRSTVTAASCATERGTLTLSVPDTNAAIPLSISFNGRPFSSDTVFPNTQLGFSYNVLVKGKSGCDLKGSTYAPIQSTLSGTIVDSCNGSNGGTLRAQGFDGTPPYTYHWSTGENTAALRDVPFGSYSVTITDALMCKVYRYTNFTECSLRRVTVTGDYVRTDSTCNARYSLNLTAFGGIPPYYFKLDSANLSITGRYTNLVGGWHTIEAIDRDGQRGVNRIYLPIDNPDWTASIVGGETTCENNGLSKYSLNVTGGRPPYRYFVNTDTLGTNLNTFWLLPNTFYSMRVKDTFGCLLSIRFITPPSFDVSTLYSKSAFLPNACGDSLGTLRLSIAANVALVTPLSLSFNNRPFSSDTVFTNVKAGQSYTLKYKTRACGERSMTVYVPSNSPITDIQTAFQITNCTAQTGRLTVVAKGGTAPMRFSLNGQPDVVSDTNIVYLTNVKAGANTLRVRSAEGCDLTKAVVLENITLTTTTVAPSCTNPSNTLTVSVPDTNAARPLSISFNGQPFSSDTVFSNVELNRFYTVVVKSKQGCALSTTVFTQLQSGNGFALVVNLPDSCGSLAGRGSLKPTVFNGTPPYKYKWSNGDSTALLAHAPLGLYTVTVTDRNNCAAQATATILSCVWSGDTDTSGFVDNRDLLNIGIAFGENGRASCPDSASGLTYCYQWIARKVYDWSKQTPNRVNFKHIDTNGDGIINRADTFAIVRNWNRIHFLQTPQTPVVTVRSVAPPLFVQTSPVSEGQTVNFPIMLGEPTAMAENVYGLACSILYPPAVIVPNSIRLVANQSWFGAPLELLSLSKDETNNVLHIGLVKTDKLNVTGSGQIATLTFKLKTGVNGSDLQFGIYNDFLINNKGEKLPSVGRPTTTKVLTETAETMWANQVNVYPNPTTGQVFIESQNVDIQSVTVMDIAGKVMGKTTEKGPLSIKTSGTYFLKLETDKGVLMKKVVRL